MDYEKKSEMAHKRSKTKKNTKRKSSSSKRSKHVLLKKNEIKMFQSLVKKHLKLDKENREVGYIRIKYDLSKMKFDNGKLVKPDSKKSNNTKAIKLLNNVMKKLLAVLKNNLKILVNFGSKLPEGTVTVKYRNNGGFSTTGILAKNAKNEAERILADKSKMEKIVYYWMHFLTVNDLNDLYNNFTDFLKNRGYKILRSGFLEDNVRTNKLKFLFLKNNVLLNGLQGKIAATKPLTVETQPEPKKKAKKEKKPKASPVKQSLQEIKIPALSATPKKPSAKPKPKKKSLKTKVKKDKSKKSKVIKDLYDTYIKGTKDIFKGLNKTLKKLISELYGKTGELFVDTSLIDHNYQDLQRTLGLNDDEAYQFDTIVVGTKGKPIGKPDLVALLKAMNEKRKDSIYKNQRYQYISEGFQYNDERKEYKLIWVS